MTSTLIIPAELRNLASLRCFVEETARALQADPEAVEDLVTAVDEAATNIIVHGYRGQPGSIEVRIGIEEDTLLVRLCDQAPLFDPTEVPPPDLAMPLEQRRFGGLGVYLARQYMDEVTYCENPEGCNELTLRRSARGESMEQRERLRKIESYGKAYSILVDALEQFPQEMWQYRPSPDGWSIHELIVHIADSEANSYVRCRRLIAEPGEPVMAYDEAQWARSLDYHQQSPEDSLELFRWLRMKTYTLIKSLPEAVWANTIYHPENGTMTFDDWLDVYERHIPEHIEQMQSNYRAWIKQLENRD